MQGIKFFDHDFIYDHNEESIIFRKKKNIYHAYKIYSVRWFRDLNFIKYSFHMFRKHSLDKYLKYVKLLPVSDVNFDFYNDFYKYEGELAFSPEKIEYCTFSTNNLINIRSVNSFYLFRILREILFVLSFLNRCSVIHKDINERSLLCSTIFCFYRKIYFNDFHMEIINYDREMRIMNKINKSTFESFGNIVFRAVCGIRPAGHSPREMFDIFSAKFRNKRGKKYTFYYNLLNLCFRGGPEIHSFYDIFTQCEKFYSRDMVEIMNSINIFRVKTIHMKSNKEYYDFAKVREYISDKRILYFFSNLYKEIAARNLFEMTDENLFIITCAVNIIYKYEFAFFREYSDRYIEIFGTGAQPLSPSRIAQVIKKIMVGLDRSVLIVFLDCL